MIVLLGDWCGGLQVILKGPSISLPNNSAPENFNRSFFMVFLTIKSTSKLSQLKFTDHKKCVLRESATEEANSVP